MAYLLLIKLPRPQNSTPQAFLQLHPPLLMDVNQLVLDSLALISEQNREQNAGWKSTVLLRTYVHARIMHATLQLVTIARNVSDCLHALI